MSDTSPDMSQLDPDQWESWTDANGVVRHAVVGSWIEACGLRPSATSAGCPEPLMTLESVYQFEFEIHHLIVAGQVRDAQRIALEFVRRALKGITFRAPYSNAIAGHAEAALGLAVAERPTLTPDQMQDGKRYRIVFEGKYREMDGKRLLLDRTYTLLTQDELEDATRIEEIVEDE